MTVDERAEKTLKVVLSLLNLTPEEPWIYKYCDAAKQEIAAQFRETVDATVSAVHTASENRTLMEYKDGYDKGRASMQEEAAKELSMFSCGCSERIRAIAVEGKP